MAGWLYRVLVGSFHVCGPWEETNRVDLWGNSTKYPEGTRVYLRCKRCGAPKKKDLH